MTGIKIQKLIQLFCQITESLRKKIKKIISIKLAPLVQLKKGDNIRMVRTYFADKKKEHILRKVY